MPTYDYICQVCGHRFERVQGFHDDPVKICPECGGLVRRVIHSAGVIFKGSGWYITDSRRGASGVDKGEAGSGAGKSEKAASKSEGKTESAGESKTETKTEKSETPAKSDAGAGAGD